MTTRRKYWLHISSTNQATSQVNTASSPQTARNFGLVRRWVVKPGPKNLHQRRVVVRLETLCRCQSEQLLCRGSQRCRQLASLGAVEDEAHVLHEQRDCAAGRAVVAVNHATSAVIEHEGCGS